eukprot:5543959-Prymnesium_polylepis.1
MLSPRLAASNDTAEKVRRCRAGTSSISTSNRRVPPFTSSLAMRVRASFAPPLWHSSCRSDALSPLQSSSSESPTSSPVAVSLLAANSSPSTSRPISHALRSIHSRVPAHAFQPPNQRLDASIAASRESNCCTRSWHGERISATSAPLQATSGASLFATRVRRAARPSAVAASSSALAASALSAASSKPSTPPSTLASTSNDVSIARRAACSASSVDSVSRRAAVEKRHRAPPAAAPLPPAPRHAAHGLC